MTLDELAQEVTTLSQRVATIEEGQRSLREIRVEAMAGEFIAGSIEGSPPPGISVTDWLSGIGGSPGIIVDPGKARSTPCLRIQLGEGRRPLIYSQGIIGALDEEQQALYCQEGYEDKPITEKQQQRIAAMEQASKLCSDETNNVDDTSRRIETYFSCLGRELKSRGHEAW
jgi:hypothetical protein